MKLTRRQRRESAALGQQLAPDDPGLAEQLSRPDLRRARTRVGVVIGRVMFVLGLLMVLGGDLLSASAAVTLGAIVPLACWVPWQYRLGLGTTMTATLGRPRGAHHRRRTSGALTGRRERRIKVGAI